LEKGDAVSKQASDAMLSIMRGQVYSSRLPRYVSGYTIPHKTGDFLPYIGNDVGVLESPSRHVIVACLPQNTMDRVLTLKMRSGESRSWRETISPHGREKLRPVAPQPQTVHHHRNTR
jgi:Beta-lactamase enzyme family